MNRFLIASLAGAAALALSNQSAMAKPAMLHFIRGAATLTLGDEVHEGEAGAFSYMPPNLPHSIVAHTETVMALVMLEAPAP